MVLAERLLAEGARWVWAAARQNTAPGDRGESMFSALPRRERRFCAGSNSIAESLMGIVVALLIVAAVLHT